MADPNQRLGGGGPEAGLEIMRHPWFSGVDWDMIMQKKIKPPFKPRLQSQLDVRYIDETFTKQKVGDSPESMSDSLQEGKWDGFSYNGKGGYPMEM